MPWGKRKHPDDSGVKISYGTESCPRCGKMITKNARGRASHIKSCLKKAVVVGGKTFAAVFT